MSVSGFPKGKIAAEMSLVVCVLNPFTASVSEDDVSTLLSFSKLASKSLSGMSVTKDVVSSLSTSESAVVHGYRSGCRPWDADDSWKTIVAGSPRCDDIPIDDGWPNASMPAKPRSLR